MLDFIVLLLFCPGGFWTISKKKRARLSALTMARLFHLRRGSGYVYTLTSGMSFFFFFSFSCLDVGKTTMMTEDDFYQILFPLVGLFFSLDHRD